MFYFFPIKFQPYHNILHKFLCPVNQLDLLLLLLSPLS